MAKANLRDLADIVVALIDFIVVHDPQPDDELFACRDRMAVYRDVQGVPYLNGDGKREPPCESEDGFKGD